MKQVDVSEAKGCLSHLAFDPSISRGRREPDESVLIDPFCDDMCRLLESKALRRLQSKTQVHCDPENPHIRDRRIHTDEVMSASIYVAEMTGLQTYLCAAAALGHDIGHTPYGHLGEEVIAQCTGKNFKHSLFSVIVAESIERKGRGLNLSYEVLDAIRHHSCKKDADEVFARRPQEGKVIVYTDPISFGFSDPGDFDRSGFMKMADLLPYLNEFGADQRARVKTCLDALILESAEVGYISFTKSEIAQKFWAFLKMMYEQGYHKLNRPLNRFALEQIYELFTKLFWDVTPGVPVALLTDKEAKKVSDLMMGQAKITVEDLKGLHLGLFEILPYLQGREIKIDEVDLSWGERVQVGF